MTIRIPWWVIYSMAYAGQTAIVGVLGIGESHPGWTALLFVTTAVFGVSIGADAYAAGRKCEEKKHGNA